VPTLSGMRTIVQRTWFWPALAALIGVAASIAGLRNQYAQDDTAIILQNGAVHSWHGIGALFTSPYWPPPFLAALYRPLASVSFVLQWMVGDGSPLAFRIVSYLLYAATCVAVFSLARIALPIAVAFGVAALFAAHPVHVEAVAMAVNQSELWVGLICCIAVIRYVRARAAGSPVSPGNQAILVGLYIAGCLFKETALVLPGLLVAAEALLVRTGGSIRTRIALGRPLLLWMMLVAVAFLWVRIQVLSGNLLGTPIAEGMIGLTRGERALTMLAVVPEWVRLLGWPARLSADYSPGEIVGQTAWGPMQTLGVLILLAAVAAAVAAWRRAPAISFGLAWCAIGLFPVHNVFVPTGIMLAERTLFLPSIGAMIALGGVMAPVLSSVRVPLRRVIGLTAAVLIAVGVYRSNLRHGIWLDQFTLWYRTANVDAPKSFRAHEALAESYFKIGVERMSETEQRLAIRYAPVQLTRPRSEYADRLRSRGFTWPAIDLYKAVLQVSPDHMLARASLIACLLDQGAYRQAGFHARLGISHDWEPAVFTMALATADSAERVAAPRGTVRVAVPPTFNLRKAMIIGEKK